MTRVKPSPGHLRYAGPMFMHLPSSADQVLTRERRKVGIPTDVSFAVDHPNFLV